MAETSGRAVRPASGSDGTSGRYKWVALSNTTLSVTMATIDASIVIIAMPSPPRSEALSVR